MQHRGIGVHRGILNVIVMASLATLIAAPAMAQDTGRVRFDGRGDLATDTVIQRILASGYRLITADTVYPAADTMRGPIIIAATTVKFENVIIGDVAIVDANVFMRPGSRITGDVVSIAAGFFRSETATIEGSVREWKEAPYRARKSGDDIVITGTQVASLFDLDGFGGLHTPAYDRVAGLTAAIGTRYLLPRIGHAEPEIHGWVGYQTAREKLIGGLDAGFRNGGYRLSAGAERAALTQDAWIKGWTNSISYAWSGRDYRDYFTADRYFLRQSYAWSNLYRTLTLSVTAQVEDAESLPSRDTWHAFGDDERLNPAIDDGRTTSAIAAADGDWETETYVGTIHASVESATDLLDGDFSFTRFDIGGEWAMLALADHTLRLKWRLRGPLGSDSLPRQRWNSLGGRANLATLETGELRGDRLVYVETEYSIPIPGPIVLPVLGRPAVELIHRIGNAWDRTGDASLVQTAGAGIRFRFLVATWFFDPADTSQSIFSAGLSFPRRYPWSPIE